MTTLYLIAYDISNDKRRTKLHKLLSSFGQWTQYSTFECYLNDKQLLTLQHRLKNLLHPQQDNVRIYPLCQTCQKNIQTIGSTLPQEPKLFII